MPPHGAAGFHVGGFPLQGLALIDGVFPFAQRDLDFHYSSGEVDLERNQGEPFLLNIALEARQFSFVQKQSAWAGGLVVEDIAVVVGLNRHLQQLRLTLVDVHIRFVDSDMSLPDRFHLCAAQRNPGLELFEDGVVPVRLAVGGDGPRRVAGFFLLRGHTSIWVICYWGFVICIVRLLDNL